MSSPKRRRLDTESGSQDFPQSFLSDVNAEVDTEIALKEQLSDTLESRIAWALMLQESLKKGSGHASQDTFRNVALDALSVTEQTSEHILQKDPSAPPPGDPTRLTTSTTARPAPRKTYFPTFKKPSFLYIRSNPLVNADANGQNHLYLLKCPGCARTAFTSLQGLLNHARLTHSLEWGTHDECIRACAVVDNDLDVEAGIEVGVGPVGILPGLRTIFQRAVGAGVQQTPGGEEIAAASGSGSGSGDPNASANANNAEEQQSSGTNHLIQTLGFHSESPALAPFLGKGTIRREIKVWDEDRDVDIFRDDTPDKPQTKKTHWKMPFTPRNFSEHIKTEAQSQSDTLGLSNATDMDTTPDSGPPAVAPQIAENVVSNQSRFHFIARIIITDHSLWIPPAQRPDREKFTHKWMMSVEAPAYAHHITSVLNSVRVGPSDPAIPVPTPPTTSSPPFVVVGFCDRPFLAKVELSFSGTLSQHKESDLSEQKVTFEHWVDLDPLENSEVFVGQDQVLDVELDKSTVLKPPRLGYAPPGTKSQWNLAAVPVVAQPQMVEQKEDYSTEENPMEKVSFELSKGSRSVLLRLARQFPMTLNGAKANRSQNSVPYRLVPTLAYFKTLVIGRRKAIEWGRARAIQEAYNQEIHTLQDERMASLSVGDVYSWMSQNRHFYREKKVAKPVNQVYIKQEQSEPIPKEEKIKTEEKPVASTDIPLSQWCRVCGLEAKLHSATKFVKMENLEDEGATKHSVKEPYAGVATLVSDQECHVVPRVLQIAKLPNVDIQRTLSLQDSQPSHKSVRNVTLDGGSMVAMVDPAMILAIQKLVEDLRLPTFRRSSEGDQNQPSELFPLDALGAHRVDVEKSLAPTALLAHLTQQFMRVLVKDGLEVAKRDKVIASGMLSSAAPQRGNRRAAGKRANAQVMLTPTHILSGILTRGRGRSSLPSSLDAVILSSLSKLAIGVEADSAAPSCQGEGESGARVKLEE